MTSVSRDSGYERAAERRVAHRSTVRSRRRGRSAERRIAGRTRGRLFVLLALFLVVSTSSGYLAASPGSAGALHLEDGLGPAADGPGAAGGELQPAPTADSATVPLIVEGDRIFVDLTVRGRDGSERTARFLIDTGGGPLILTEPLARELGLEWGEPFQGEGQTFALLRELPRVFAGGFELEVVPNRAAVLLGDGRILPPSAPGRAEGFLPGHILARYHVVFDYPGRTFTVARPGVLEPQGTPMPMPVSEFMGFPRTELEIDGERYGLLLDTGASFTMISGAVMNAWGERHPEWPRYEGAHGDAAMLDGMNLTRKTMYVPAARWGGFELGEFGVAWRPEGVFENVMSQMMAAPVVGALGGNVLKHFRLELDYANQVLYLSRPETALR
jgi:predicted aspartyl protease